MDLLALFGLTEEERAKIAPKDFAKPPDGFPIDTQAHLDAAAKLIGKEPEAEQAKIKARAIRIAKRNNLTLPKTWQESADMAATDLMSNDIESALQDALSDAYPPNALTGAYSYIYVVDFNPSQNFVIFSRDGDKYRQSYTMSDTGAVTLTGEPVDVAQHTTWVAEGDAAMGAFEMASFEAAGEYVEYSGPIFEAGNYPGQRIDMSVADVAAACERFQPVPVKDTHTQDPLQSLFYGRMGELAGAWMSGGKMHGKLRLPSWVNAALDGRQPKVSVEIDRQTKRLTGIALLNFPQVPSAQVRAAFAAFAGARHSKADMERIQAVHDNCVGLGAACGTADMGRRHSGTDTAAIQQMHDLAAEQGATCVAADTTPAVMSSPRPASAGAARARRTTMSRSLWDRFLTSLGSKAEAVQQAGLTQATFEAGLEEPTTSDPALAAQMAEFERSATIFRAKALREAAARFANDIVHNQRRALISQSGDVAAMYVSAANLDGGGTARFSESSGDVEEGEAVKQLKAYFEKQPQVRALMGEAISDKGPKEKDRDARTRVRAASAVEAYNRGGN